MRAWLLAALLAGAWLTGCIGDTDDGIEQQSLGPGMALLEGRVTRFSATGDLLPIDDVVGTIEYVLTGHKGAEPNVGITRSGAIFATAADVVIRSTDGGQTWEKVWHLVPEDDGLVPHPALERGVVRSWDPMLWVDPITDRVYADPMWPPLACTWLAWSEDDGESWAERPGVCHPPPMDHQKLTSGVPGPDTPSGLATSETVLYQCYNAVVSTNCGVSYDQGMTWVVHQVAADEFTQDCGGINGHPMVSDKGIVALPITSCSEPGVAFSRDSGLSWTLTKVPWGAGTESTDAEVSWAGDTLFYSFRGDDHVTYLSRSDDEGATWTEPVSITPPGIESTVFHALHADESGRLAAGLLGTAEAGGPDGAPDEAHWHLFIVTSENAFAKAPTFTAYQVTPDDDPVQVGSICMGGVTCSGGNRNLLDFIDGAVSPDGTFHVIYTEGCTDGCAGDPDAEPGDSRDREVALGSLKGWSLFG